MENNIIICGICPPIFKSLKMTLLCNIKYLNNNIPCVSLRKFTFYIF